MVFKITMLLYEKYYAHIEAEEDPNLGTNIKATSDLQKKSVHEVKPNTVLK